MPTIEAVLFDFGLVLTGPPNPEVWAELQQLSGLSEEALRTHYWRDRDAYDAGALTGMEYWAAIGQRSGRTYEPELLRELNRTDVRLWSDLNGPMVDWVLRLHRADVKTGILSNMGDEMSAGLQQSFDWIGDFHHAVWSHELRMRKPQPEIYAAAVRGLDVPAGHILFVDDKQENTLAAQAAGMHAIVYSDHEIFVRDMNARGLEYLLEPRPSGSLEKP